MYEEDWPCLINPILISFAHCRHLQVSNSFRGFCAKLDREEREEATSPIISVASGAASPTPTNATNNTPRKRLR